MKNLFRACFIVFCLFAVTKSSAQDSNWQFGLKAGLNFANMSGDADGDVKTGFNVGISLDHPISKSAVLLLGFEYTTKGFKEDGGKMNIGYLQIPVHVGYKLPVSMHTLIIHAGPYFAYGVNGEIKSGGMSVDMFESYSGLTPLNRFDFGIGLGARLDINPIYISVGYDFGLVNIADDLGQIVSNASYGYYSDINIKNRNLYLSLGFKF